MTSDQPSERVQGGEVETPAKPSAAVVDGVRPVLGMLTVMVVGWQLMEFAFTTPYSMLESGVLVAIALVAYLAGKALDRGDALP